MKTQKDIDFENISDFIKVEENRAQLYDDYKTLLSYLYKEEDILYLINEWPTQFRFEIEELQLVNSKILNSIDEKHYLNLEALLNVKWYKMNHEHFISFIKKYTENNDFKKHLIISLIPLLEIPKIRAVRNLLPFTPDEFIDIMNSSYDFKTNRYAMINEQLLTSKTKISAMWEMKNQGLLGFIEKTGVKSSHFIQNEVYLYLKKQGIKDDLGYKSITHYHFENSSANNFIAIMQDIKKECENNQYIYILEDLITGKYLNKNLSSDSKSKKISYLIKELHNCDPFEVRKIYHKITNPVMLRAFLTINSPFYTYLDYDININYRDKCINGRLIRVLEDYKLLKWEDLNYHKIDSILKNMLYQTSNKERIWNIDDIKMTINNLLSKNESLFFKSFFSATHLNVLTDIRTDILELIPYNLNNEIMSAVKSDKQYSDKSLIFIAELEKRFINQNMPESHKSFNTKRRM